MMTLVMKEKKLIECKVNNLYNFIRNIQQQTAESKITIKLI